MHFKKLIVLFFLVSSLIVYFFATQNKESTIVYNDGKIHYSNEISVVLSDEKITVNGKTVNTALSSIYPSHDVVYYEDRDFYDSGNPYGLGTSADKHTAEEAAEVTVVNITQPGTYRLSGKLNNGQIRIDLGKKAKSNEKAVVNLVFDSIDINCDIAPAIIFKNVYECDDNQDAEKATKDVDISNAGANIILADGSVNNISGSHVAKVFKDSKGQYKRWKQDGAIYSYMSMNINGEPQNSGILNLTADFEGISTEKHIAVNGGNTFIVAHNDGINANDEFSVVTINGGHMRIMAGLNETGGDGIDSNGWIVTNGGSTVSIGCRLTDSGIDDELSCYLNGGTLVSYGFNIDWADLVSEQTCFNLQFKEDISTSDAIIITDKDDNVIFCYDGKQDSVLSQYSFPRIGVVVSSPLFEVGETYHLYLGGDIDGDDYYGMYDPQSVKNFKNSSMQGYYKIKKLFHGPYIPIGEKIYVPNTDFLLEDTVTGFVLITDKD